MKKIERNKIINKQINRTKKLKRSKKVSQTAFTCSKLTIKTLGWGVKYVQS